MHVRQRKNQLKVKSNSKDIYFNVWDRIHAYPNFLLYIFVGGRGTGKTYGTLKEFAIRAHTNRNRFIYLRRSEVEVENCCSPVSNPFKAINADLGTNIQLKVIKDMAVITDNEDEENPEVIGYAGALSTFGKFRGMDFSDVEYIVFDEFINTNPMSKMKNEFMLLMNAIETVNRNREFNPDGTVDNSKSVKVIMLSNANTLDDDILRTLNIPEIIRQMKVNDEHVYIDEDRGIYYEDLKNKNFTDMKMKTRLYKLTKGTSFYDMSLENDFTSDYFGDLKKVNYNQLTPICSYKHMYFYKHKSKDIIFCCRRKAQCVSYDEQTLKSFKLDYWHYLESYRSRGNLFYQDYNLKLDYMHIM